MRVCTACGRVAPKYKHICTCGARFPIYQQYKPLTVSGQRRSEAAKRILAGMEQACPKCGLRGEHTCIFTEEWKQEQLALMANRQRTQ